jgi:acyl-CoA reductase-like NAD-dependent aldehyde dehydrogenase
LPAQHRKLPAGQARAFVQGLLLRRDVQPHRIGGGQIDLAVQTGLDPATQLGPVQNAAPLAKVEAFAEAARRDGGRVLCGGRRRPGPGYFYEPTVVAGLTDGSRLVDEEPFGPIVPVIAWRDLDEVVARANANPQGLGGSVWSADAQRATEVALRLECGTVWVNEHGAIQPDAPFGGIKQSGIGVEFGAHGLAEYTAIRTVKVMK